MGKRHVGSNPTMKRALGKVGRDDDGGLSAYLRRRQEFLENETAARNARIRRAREQRDPAPEVTDG